ncbi:MAG: hypothetical protein PHS40_11570 [Mariniphaga sp.]|nr:hypothetical protein [Mariniphaga sp.]
MTYLIFFSGQIYNFLMGFREYFLDTTLDPRLQPIPEMNKKVSTAGGRQWIQKLLSPRRLQSNPGKITI